MSKAIVLYLHCHQPFRLRNYTVFEAGNEHRYFETDHETDFNNRQILLKVAEKSYMPTNKLLIDLIQQNPEFKINLSITGLLIEQLQIWAPDVLRSFQDLVATGNVEIAAETYHHSLAFFYDRKEFERQVDMHNSLIKEVFDHTPTVFRNTELAYNNELAKWAEDAGYKGILAEGWDPVLGWRSPNYMYRPVGTSQIKLLLKNYKMSDDIAFRFGNEAWSEWPLTSDKFAHWLNETGDAEIFNLFMDYETFGEHQWDDKGIFDFLRKLPEHWLDNAENKFLLFSEALRDYEPKDEIDMPSTVTWADTERDLTAWVGNNMQQEAIKALYDLGEKIVLSQDQQLAEDWRKLQTSDHFYYMCTKWSNDGDVHSYFSPYSSPYDAFINFMNVYHDLHWRVQKVEV